MQKERSSDKDYYFPGTAKLWIAFSLGSSLVALVVALIILMLTR